RDTVASVREAMAARAAAAGDPRLVVSFPIPVPANFSEDEVRTHLEAQGYTRVQASEATDVGRLLHVAQDRFRLGSVDDARISDAVESALSRGHGRLSVHALDDDGN